MKYVAILDSNDGLSEEAINELKETAFVGDEKIPYCFEVTSIKEELKALEQEPCEDAVNRQAVCEFLENHAKTYDDVRVRIGLKAGSSLVANPDNVPSVTPAPKKCHNENKDYDDCDQFVCSNCGIELQDWHQVERDEDDGNVSYHEYEFHFCPNCGAKIESEE